MKNQPQQMFRQGDALIRAVAAIPANATDVTPKGERIVLAHGEVTGHAHAIAEGEAREFSMQDASGVVTRFLQSLGKHQPAPSRILERLQNSFGEQLMLDTAAGPTMFAANDVEDAGAVATPRAPFSRLVHEEHAAHGLLAGCYGINNPQREYHPEELRNVVD